MVKKSVRNIQYKIVNRIDELVNPKYGLNWSIRKAAREICSENGANSLYSINESSCIRYYKCYLQFGSVPAEGYHLMKRNSIKWTNRNIAILKRIVDAQPYLYLDEITDLLYEEVGIKFSYQSISTQLKKMKYTRKVMYEKAMQQIAKDKEEFIETCRLNIIRPEMAIYIDESNKNRQSTRRKYGYGGKGKTIKFRAIFNRDIQFTFIAAANMYGFVIPACDEVLHMIKEKEEHKPVDAERFVQYIKQYLVPVLGNYWLEEANSVVIMDNCSIHLDPRVRELIEGAGAILIFSSPYSPEIIPIEYMFSHWKSYLKRHQLEFTTDNWYQVHIDAISSITIEQGMNFFKTNTLHDLINNHPNYPPYRKRILNIIKMLMIIDLMENE
jgi:transposase